MRYLIQPVLSNESVARRDYLYNSLHLWFFETNTTVAYTELVSMPSSLHSEVLFVVGHNRFVKNLLSCISIPEEIIVAITCNGDCNFKALHFQTKKELFLPHLNKTGMAELLDGRQFGFNFDITESELMFFNSPKKHSIHQRIVESFQQFQ